MIEAKRTRIAVAIWLSLIAAICMPFVSSWADSSGNLLRSISSSIQRSIEGSGRRSIEGSGRRSIEGSGRRSIEGSGRRSIEGSGRRSIEGSGRRGAVSSQGGNPLLSVYGPITGGNDGVVEVLGQAFQVSASTPIEIGRSAYVEAELIGGEWQVSYVEIFDDYSVPGATPIFVNGSVEGVVGSVGHLMVGSLDIDVNAAGSEAYRVVEGATVVVTGTQPVLGGVILAGSVLVLDENGSSGPGTSTR